MSLYVLTLFRSSLIFQQYSVNLETAKYQLFMPKIDEQRIRLKHLLALFTWIKFQGNQIASKSFFYIGES